MSHTLNFSFASFKKFWAHIHGTSKFHVIVLLNVPVLNMVSARMDKKKGVEKGGGSRREASETAFSEKQTRPIWKHDKNVSSLMMSAGVLTSPLQCLCCFLVCVCMYAKESGRVRPDVWGGLIDI